MLANGITLGVKLNESNSYTNLPGLKSVPDIGPEPEKVDNTPLSASHFQYEKGIGDLPDMTYNFIFVNDSASDSYRVLRSLADSNATSSFQQSMPDGTKYTFDAQVSLKVTGGGVNTPISFDATLIVQSAITVTDPA
jgi:hypothetical protein